MPKIKIDTIYEPIEIEIRGHTFTVRPITGEIIRENFKVFDDLLRNGDLHASYERLIFLLDAKSKEEKKLIESLEVREMQEITEVIILQAFGSRALSRRKADKPVSEKEAEKNGSRTGAIK
jgi:hypothetical protein